MSYILANYVSVGRRRRTTSIESTIKNLKESREPSKGIFWFVKKDHEDEYKILYLGIPVSEDIQGNSKNGLTYTHEKTWKSLVTDKEISSYSWNYFPRGRVELRNFKANIYLNPNIDCEPYRSMIIDAFNLKCTPCRFIADGSNHYKCYLDD